MSKYVFNRDGGSADQFGHLLALSRLLNGQVIGGPTAFQITQDTGSNMAIRVLPGAAAIPTGTSPGQFHFFVGTDTSSGDSVTITTANPSNPRIDTIVAYVDLGVTPSTASANNPNNMLKFAAVAGTPAGSPSAPSSSAIQTAIGGSNPYIVLANVAVAAAVTQITTANVTDQRIMANLGAGAKGWNYVSDTWTYSSYTSGVKTGVVTVPSDGTQTYWPGQKGMFLNNGTVQYFIVTAVTSTTVTMYFGTDYSLTNSTISFIYVSNQKAPAGFPLDPAKWTVKTSSTAQPSKASPATSTWYGDTALSATGLNIALPIGVWALSYQTTANFQLTTGGNTGSVNVSLSTATNSESDNEWTGQFRINAGASSNQRSIINRQKNVTVASSTTYYLIIQTLDATSSSIGYGTPQNGTLIQAVCAYL